jgi:hypothetical protein
VVEPAFRPAFRDSIHFSASAAEVADLSGGGFFFIANAREPEGSLYGVTPKLKPL